MERHIGTWFKEKLEHGLRKTILKSMRLPNYLLMAII